jgi:uncharacterized protein (TIGR02466 family)
MHPNQFNTFEVPLWGFVLKEHHYQTFNYVERILELEASDQTANKSNRGGFQTRDNINETEGIFKELIRFIESISNDVLKEYNASPVRIKEMWGNVNSKNNFNLAHTHSGILSGVFYCQVPENSGNLVFLNPAVRSDGHLIRNKNLNLQPERLALILFPSWLEHYVEPNLSDEKRISLSFNIG